MSTNGQSGMTSPRKFKVFLKNPRTGKLLAGDGEYNSLVAAHHAAEYWQELQFLKHWRIVIEDRNGVAMSDDSQDQ
jgi:hypothetical protein